MNLRMTRDQREVWPDTTPAGSYSIDPYDASNLGSGCDATHRLLYVCPTSWPPESRRCSLLLGISGNERTEGLPPVWAWNGDADHPTIKPSINCPQCGWCGNVISGVMVGC